MMCSSRSSLRASSVNSARAILAAWTSLKISLISSGVLGSEWYPMGILLFVSNPSWRIALRKRVTLLVVESGSDTHWRKIVRPPQHHSGNAAVVDVRRVCRGHELSGVAAKVISDPSQLRLFESRGPRHDGVVSSIGVIFAALNRSRHFRFSPSALNWRGACPALALASRVSHAGQVCSESALTCVRSQREIGGFWSGKIVGVGPTLRRRARSDFRRV